MTATFKAHIGFMFIFCESRTVDLIPFYSSEIFDFIKN